MFYNDTIPEGPPPLLNETSWGELISDKFVPTFDVICQADRSWTDTEAPLNCTCKNGKDSLLYCNGDFFVSL